MKLSWKDVFNTSNVSYGHFSRAATIAKSVGYKYFVWNDRVYSSETSEDTGVLVKDLG